MVNHIIKFKAKRLDNGEWVEDFYYKECDNTYIIEDRQKDSMLNRNEAVLVDPSTICQFTGLKNKNSVEIWEHDYISTIHHHGEVIFEKGGFLMRGDVGDIPLESLVDRAGDGTSETYGKCLVVNQGSMFDRKEGEI